MGLFHISVAPLHLRFNSGVWFQEARQATSCDCRPVTWRRRPAVFTSEVTVDVGQRGQPGAEVTESGSHVRRAALAAPILLYTPPPSPQPIPRTPPPPPLLTALGPDYKISLVWSGLILEKPNPCLRVTPTGIITPQQTHLQEFAHKVSWWADFKAIGDTSCVRLSKKNEKDSKF